MPRYIVKIGDRYGEWSTIVDAPVTYLVPLEEFRAYYTTEYGRSSAGEFAERVARADAKGTSSHLHNSANDVMACNRFGDREGCLPVSECRAKWERESDEYAALRGAGR